LVLSVLLVVVVFREGNPFSDPENESDLDDIRSIQYDSLRLAQKEVQNLYEESSEGARIIRKQSETADFTYWVFEAETPQGVFSSRDSVGAMKEAFEMFLQDENYEQYCLLKYPDTSASNSNGTQEQPYCDPPASPLNLYYAAKWDSDQAEAVLEELKTPGNIDTFNALALCYARGLYCENVNPEIATQQDIAWALELNTNLTEMSSHWDMSGPLVENITQLTEFAAYLKRVDLFRGAVDFGYDKGFSVDNLVSIYSRGILLWGGPLDGSSSLSEEEKEDQDEVDTEDRKE
jgi:hypothetical protein